MNGRGSSSPTGCQWGDLGEYSTLPKLTLLGELHLSGGLNNTLVLVGEAELGQSSSGDKETGSVGGGPVGKTVLNTVLAELLGGSVGEDDISLGGLGVVNLGKTSQHTWSLA